MAICNDGAIICDRCNNLFWDEIAELWPRWISGPWGPERRYDPGFHVCLGCLRRMFADQYGGELAATPR